MEEVSVEDLLDRALSIRAEEYDRTKLSDLLIGQCRSLLRSGAWGSEESTAAEHAVEAVAGAADAKTLSGHEQTLLALMQRHAQDDEDWPVYGLYAVGNLVNVARDASARNLRRAVLGIIDAWDRAPLTKAERTLNLRGLARDLNNAM